MKHGKQRIVYEILLISVLAGWFPVHRDEHELFDYLSCHWKADRPGSTSSRCALAMPLDSSRSPPTEKTHPESAPPGPTSPEGKNI